MTIERLNHQIIVLAKSLIALSFLAIILATLPPSKVNYIPNPVISGVWEISSGFASKAVFPTTDNSVIPDRISAYGSWIGSDQSIGASASPWYKNRGPFRILICGYPNLVGNELYIETVNENGDIRRINYAGQNPGESWASWEIVLNNSESKFKIIAIDGMSTTQGWLGYSAPFTRELMFGSAITNIFTFLSIISFLSLAIVLVLGIGIGTYHHFKPRMKTGNIILMIVPGPITLAFSGLVVWLFSNLINPKIMSYAIIILLLCITAYKLLRINYSQFFSKEELFVLAVVIITIFICVGKVSYSGGPEGELYGGKISRTYEVGDRSDSRISYHTVQLIANNIKPFEPDGKKFFDPYSYTSRGPLAGLASSPLAILAAENIPKSMPDQEWAPFDQYGFAVYRYVMLCMASLSIIAVYGLLSKITTSHWAILGVHFLILTPFFIHEEYFTWPKLIAAAYVLLSFYFNHDNRFFLSGLFFTIAYLWHPLAFTILPFFLIYLVKITCWNKKIYWKSKSCLKRLAIFGIGFLSLFAPWSIFSIRHPAGPSFFNYVFLANYVESGPKLWLLSRIDSLFNTIIPLYLFLINSDNPAVNSIYAKSSNIVHFCFQYWNTLPFGMGIIFFLAISCKAFKMIRKFLNVWLLAFILPLISLDIYWGAATTGLMRECGHIIFLSLIILVSWSSFKNSDTFFIKLMKNKWFNALRAMEVFFMMYIPSFITSARIFDSYYQIVDILSLTLTIIGLICLVILPYQYWTNFEEPE